MKKTKQEVMKESKWLAYIPDDGNWNIPYSGNFEDEARGHLRKMLKLTKLPRGTRVFLNPDYKEDEIDG